MSKRIYTDADQALAAVTLQVNDGNIRRTARETGVPISTVRDWKSLWEREGYPQPVEAALPEARKAFLDEAKHVRFLMVQRLREKVEKGEASARDLITGIGVLTDKINVMEGMATSRTETVQAALPDARELALELGAFIQRTVSDAVDRSNTIDGDWEEVPNLELVSNSVS